MRRTRRSVAVGGLGIRTMRGLILVVSAAMVGIAPGLAATPALAAVPHSSSSAASRPCSSHPPTNRGRPGLALLAPLGGQKAQSKPASPRAACIGTFTHSPAPNSSSNLPPGSGPIMPSTTIYYDFWLPTGDHYESDAAGDTNYENLLIRWAHDVGNTQYHNLVTQYSGNNGGSTTFITNSVTFGGSWVDTAAYPHTGTTSDPLQDSDIQTEVHNAVTTNGWTEDINHIVAVFTATGIHECLSASSCTYSPIPNGFCAYHQHFTDGSSDAIYAYMSFDNFTHLAGTTCVAGQTSGDTDPNKNIYPNGDVSADAEVNTLSHEVTEAETDPHPNATWTGPNGEIGDACNFNFTPRNSSGADVYLNGHPYIVQQEWSNAISTCGIDLATNGFCTGSVSNACSPTTTYSKSVDNTSPFVASTINYTLTLNNTNDTGAETNLTVTDSPPSGYSITNVTAPGASSPPTWTATSATINFDTLPVHQAQAITISATVPIQAGMSATNCGAQSGSDLIGTALPSQTTSPCAITTPVKIPTTLTYTGPGSGDFHDPATVSATLTDNSNNPLSGKAIDFTLNGSEHCTGTTDASGSASCSITPGEAAGPYTLVVSFGDSSDPKYATTSTSPTFTVTKEETSTAYTGPAVILAGGSGVTLKGQLLEDGNPAAPIAGRTLTLGLGGKTCTGTTNSGGIATCQLTFTGALGPEPLSASFAGDNYYLPSSDNSQTAIVFAFPTRGAFALGDLTVNAATPGTTVTWWADTWNQFNSLSGGPAPSAFKGFAASVNLPTSSPPSICGSNWTTLPGNSPPPTSGVPSYMGVLVTSKVTKTGNGVTGNTVHIVVVKTNPGYAPNPMSFGTGTIVATYC
jgi:uncharacterized repeat protein (TIGR01451 family)